MLKEKPLYDVNTCEGLRAGEIVRRISFYGYTKQCQENPHFQFPIIGSDETMMNNYNNLFSNKN